jgi:hypothetical protein
MQSTINLNKIYKLFFGGLMSIFHVILIYGTFFLIILTENIGTLMILGLILTLILFVDTIYDDCPITLIEKHYLGNSLSEIWNKCTSENCEKREKREITLQWIFMGLMVILTKGIVLLFKKTFKEMGLFENVIITIK